MKKLKIILFLLSFNSFLFAADHPYAVSKIPVNLLKNANAVLRTEQIVFEVVNTGEAVLRKKYAVTIMNEFGERHSIFIGYYDKLHEIKDIEGVLYDATGKELKKLRNHQVIDVSGVGRGNLMDDNRVKAHSFLHSVYPYTVQYEVRIKYNGTLFFPQWIPRASEKFSVVHSSVSIIHDPGYTVRYKAFNYPGPPAEKVYEKNKRMLTWEVKELPAIENEFGAPAWHEVNPSVIFGPTEFEIEKYKGNMNSWNDFGKFVYSLKEGRDELPDHVKKIVHDIAGKYSNPADKIEQLYNYLQKNTRYISIQLGIGGWQPFDAKYVASNAYGDCKALTNYMYSLLKEAGIPSVYTLVRAGKEANEVIADFPSQQFNHVILSVPLPGDTVWLECTSQSLPAGYLSSFTADRYALMVTEKGSTLVRTPAYGVKENVTRRTIKAVLDEAANLDISSVTQFDGLNQDFYHHMINELSREKVKERLQKQFDLTTYEIRDFTYNEFRTKIPSIRESVSIQVSNYANITGKRLFIIPNILNRHNQRLQADKERLHDLDLGWGYSEKDTVEITIPAGYKPETIPADIDLSSPFGNYKSRLELAGNKILYYRDYQFNGGKFPASSYTDLVKFFDVIYKADRNRLVLVRDALKGF